MSNGSSNNDDSLDWDSNRKKVIHQEGIRVLQAQKSDIDDLDDKSLRTVRIIAILLAVGATVVEIGEVRPNMDGLLVSLLFLLISAIFGVIVYNESYEVVGPKSSYFRKLENDDFDEPWQDDFIHQIPHWIKENQKTVEINTHFFTLCQVLFLIGFSVGILALIGINSGTILGVLSVLSVIVTAGILAIMSYI